MPLGTVLHLNGVDCTLTGGAPPHKPSSQGKLWLEGQGFTMEIYPSVFSLKWTRE